MKVILHYFAETARKFVPLHFNKSISRSELAHIMHSSSRASGISRLTVKIKKKIIEVFSCFDSVVLTCGIYNMVVSFHPFQLWTYWRQILSQQPREGARGGNREERREQNRPCVAKTD